MHHLADTTRNPLVDCPELVKLVEEICDRNPDWNDERVFEEVMQLADQDPLLRGRIVGRVIASLVEPRS